MQGRLQEHTVLILLFAEQQKALQRKLIKNRLIIPCVLSLQRVLSPLSLALIYKRTTSLVLDLQIFTLCVSYSCFPHRVRLKYVPLLLKFLVFPHAVHLIFSIFLSFSSICISPTIKNLSRIGICVYMHICLQMRKRF